jgi:hypothetical protein
MMKNKGSVIGVIIGMCVVAERVRVGAEKLAFKSGKLVISLKKSKVAYYSGKVGLI